MKLTITLMACVFAAVPLAAQGTMATPPGAYTDGQRLSNFSRMLESYDFSPGRRDTPERKAERLAAALALKAEAVDLQAADGGTLTRKHKAYIRAKAEAILRN